jgi:hypothetical protein
MRGSVISGRSACTCDTFPKGREAITQAGHGSLRGGKFCRHDHIDSWQTVLGEAEALADQTPESITLYCIPGGLDGNSQPHPRVRKPVCLDAQREEAVIDPTTTRVDRVELQLAPQSQVRAQAKRALR